MYRSKRILLLSSSIILLCACLIAGATFALFTDSMDVSTHLKAGDLEVALVRESGYYEVLDTDGTMKTVNVGAATYTGAASDPTENFFGITENDLIVPTSDVETIFTLKNTGTTAFTYTVEIFFETDTETDAAKKAANKALADQLYVEMGKVETVEENGVTVNKYVKVEDAKPLSSFTEQNGAYKINGGQVLSEHQSARLYVKVTFKDDGNNVDNNNAMNGAAAFDMRVEAIQYTDKK